MTDSASPDVTSCFHCGLPLPKDETFSENIVGSSRRFCCIGCRAVCKAIYDAGLEGFYQRTPEGQLLAPPPPPPKDAALYDIDEVQEEYVSQLGEEREINLLVEGIHCAACVWLIERTLGKLHGIVSANVNLAGRRLLVRWNNNQIKLSGILGRLADIGYSAVPFDPEVAEGSLKRQNRTFIFRIAFAGFAMMNLLWISIALYTGASKGEFRIMFYWIGFALATPTLFYSGWPFLKGAWTGLRRLHLTMDLPIALGASITYFYSVYVTFFHPHSHGVYYDTVVNFLFVILIGRQLESMSKRRAVAATQRLIDLQPRGATVLRNGAEQLLPIRAVKVGETVLVRAGDKVPVDGIVLEGHSAIDESMLSGESRPVNKGPGDAISAGTVNTRSALTAEVTGTLRDTALGRIIRLVEDAQASKAPIQCTADKIVPWFVAITLVLATITFLWWLHVDFQVALLSATSVLIITCPCAFGLATPMAIAVASGLGARHGILVKNGAVLETMSAITHFVFDKTGTLTEGRMAVTNIITDGDVDTDDLLLKAAAVERFSEHNVAKAIVESARERELGIFAPRLEGFQSVPGCGVAAQVDGVEMVLGTEAWLIQRHIALNSTLTPQTQAFEDQGISCVYVAFGGRHVGILTVADRLRPEARRLVDALRAEGIRMTLLSGDRRRVAESIAEQLGGMDVIAEVLPEDKDRVIAELQHRGERVAMIGDGVNDAPALIRANVGIAVGSGTDVSVESADIVLISSELDKIRLATLLSRRSLRTIRQNLGISLAYNLIMVPLAMAAFITPLVAAISMPVSSLLVIGNAARIRTLFKKNQRI